MGKRKQAIYSCKKCIISEDKPQKSSDFFLRKEVKTPVEACGIELKGSTNKLFIIS
jgi:hypothetical protein